MAMPGDMLVVITGGRGDYGIYWVEAKEAATQLRMHRTIPTTRGSLAKVSKCQS